jgi:transcriptional regulator with XRE-family HTH domain
MYTQSIQSQTLVEVEEGYSNLLLRALGQRIRELRTARGYSQESFADACEVHRTFMGTVERGESNLSFHNIARVATTLGVSLSTLFLDLEAKVKTPAAQSPGAAAAKTTKDPARKRTP